jgi:hypothetical protein
LTPFLYWGDASDPEKEPLTFDVYLSLVSNYQATNYQLIGSTTGHSMQVGPLQLHRRYYWRVKVKDSVWSVNGQEQWFDVGGYATPVLFSRFNAEPSGTNVEIHWTLQSDETMDSYTLFRHEGATGPALAIANAPVEGIEGSYVDKSVAPGKTYRYELMIRTTDGDEFRSPLVSVTTTAPGITLYQNVPNPFNPVTTIRYDLPASARVQVSIVDVSGRRVRSLTDELQAPGSHNAIWNGRDDTGSAVASGVYFSVLQAGKQRFTKKLVLLK